MDLIFIYDSSGSINKVDPNNWQYMLTFAKSFVDRLVIAPDAQQVGFVLIGNNGKLTIKLNEYSDATQLKTAIDGLLFDNQKTNIPGGLTMAQDAFTPAMGGRGNVRKVAIFITDGEASNPAYPDPQPTAADLKNSGVEVFVISHNQYFVSGESTMLLVQTIASEQLVDHLFVTGDFGALANYGAPIKATMDRSCVTPTSNPFVSSTTTTATPSRRSIMLTYLYI